MLQTRHAHFSQTSCSRFASESIARLLTDLSHAMHPSLGLNLASPPSAFCFLLVLFVLAAHLALLSVFLRIALFCPSCFHPPTHANLPPPHSNCLSRWFYNGASTTIPTLEERRHHVQASQPSLTPNTVTICLLLSAGRQ